LLLLVLIVVVLRCVIRLPPPATADVELFAVGDMDRHVEAVPTGVDRALVETFPLVKFRDDLFESSDDAHCAVCLADYDEQESLRKLPACSHYFHVSCIGEWLRTRCSCPLCRRYVLLQPTQAEPGQAAQAERGQGTQAAQGQAVQADVVHPTQAEQVPAGQCDESSECGERGESAHTDGRLAMQWVQQAQEEGQQVQRGGCGVAMEGCELIQGGREEFAMREDGCGEGVCEEQHAGAHLQLKNQQQQQRQEQEDGEKGERECEKEGLMRQEEEVQLLQQGCGRDNGVIYSQEPASESLLNGEAGGQHQRQGEGNAEQGEHACTKKDRIG
ncbi:hypothetical protein CLOM_g4157, partial [Closterium sp. NIES-68]